MKPLLQRAEALLTKAGFEISEPLSPNDDALAFENDTVLGFVVAYDSPDQLIAGWSAHGNRLASERQLQLRAAGTKAWNVYLVLLATAQPSYAETIGLGLIEEDLRGMRKIARAGVTDNADLRSALLSLLPFQVSPVLESVDMRSEIRSRTTELDTDVVDAFLSTADEGFVLQILEESS